MGISILSSQQVRDIKRMVWEGAPQREVAQWAGITQATVSRIVTGDQWFQVPWPDGSVGGLPIEQRVRLHIVKYSRRTIPDTGQYIQTQQDHPLLQIAGAVEQEVDDAIEETLRRAVEADGGEDTPLLPSDRGGDRSIPGPRAVFERQRWEAVVQLAGDNALVRGAGEDQLRKAAIVEVFSNLPSGDWNKAIAVKLVEEVYRQYKTND